MMRNAPEDQGHVWPVCFRPILEAEDFPVPVVGQDHAAELRHFQDVTRQLAASESGHPKRMRGAPSLHLIVTFHRGNLQRLVFYRIQAVEIAYDDLGTGATNTAIHMAMENMMPAADSSVRSRLR